MGQRWLEEWAQCVGAHFGSTVTSLCPCLYQVLIIHAAYFNSVYVGILLINTNTMDRSPHENRVVVPFKHVNRI